MTEQEITDLVTRSLYSVAPDIEGETIERSETFREQFEIDSMDFLNFITAIHEATGVNIPEADYPQLESLEKCISYLSART